MSFGFGVGDAITIIALITQTYQSCSTAPSKIKDAYAQTRTINTHLTIISNEYPQHETTLAKNQKLSKHFSQTLDCLKRDLRALHKLIRKWKTGLWGDKGWFILTDMSDVMRLREELAEHNETIHLTILPHLRWETDRAAKRESAKKQSKQTQALEAEFARLRREVARERKKAWSRERKLLRELIKLKGQGCINAAAHSSDAGAWDEIEADLARTRRDLSREEAKRILGPYKEEIKTCQLEKPPKGKEVDGKKTSERKKPKTNGDEKKEDKFDSPKNGDSGKESNAVNKKEGEKMLKTRKTDATKKKSEKKSSGSSGSGKKEGDTGEGKSDAKKKEASPTAHQDSKERTKTASESTSPLPKRGRQDKKEGEGGKSGGLLQVPSSALRSRSVPPGQPDDVASLSSGRARAGSTSGLSRSSSNAGSSSGRSSKNSSVGGKANGAKA